MSPLNEFAEGIRAMVAEGLKAPPCKKPEASSWTSRIGDQPARLCAACTKFHPESAFERPTR